MNFDYANFWRRLAQRHPELDTSTPAFGHHADLNTSFVGQHLRQYVGVYVHAVFGGGEADRRDLYVEAYTENRESAYWKAVKRRLKLTVVGKYMPNTPVAGGAADRRTYLVRAGLTPADLTGPGADKIIADLAVIYDAVLRAL